MYGTNEYVSSGLTPVKSTTSFVNSGLFFSWPSSWKTNMHFSMSFSRSQFAIFRLKYLHNPVIHPALESHGNLLPPDRTYGQESFLRGTWWILRSPRNVRSFDWWPNCRSNCVRFRVQPHWPMIYRRPIMLASQMSNMDFPCRRMGNSVASPKCRILSIRTDRKSLRRLPSSAMFRRILRRIHRRELLRTKPLNWNFWFGFIWNICVSSERGIDIVVQLTLDRLFAKPMVRQRWPANTPESVRFARKPFSHFHRSREHHSEVLLNRLNEWRLRGMWI